MLDNEIIDLYFERNEQAIDATAEKYGAYCNQIAYNILADIHDSEECVNDTYMKAWNTIPPTRPNVLSAFLAKITRNIAIDRYKGDHAQKRGDKLAESIDELYGSIDDNNTWNTLELSELGELISKFLYTQKEAARRIFVLRYFYEYSIDDIAHIYGTGASYVKTKLHRTRTALAKYLKSEGVNV
ncbi:MAG: sigma-70 family RNA polymerase sigma factor [Clostridia bacterium]|nr:sigma-70 family RNA polymerase sigma factor [Clostridia bacterium]